MAGRHRVDPRSLTLLSAAAFLNLHALAQRLLDHGNNPEDHGMLLAPAIQAAAQAGNAVMMQRLRPHQRLRVLDRAIHVPLSRPLCDGNWAIIGAAIRGEMHLLQPILAYEVPGMMSYIPFFHRACLAERAYASTPAIYDCITNAFPPEYSEQQYAGITELEFYAELGNISMVHHLLNREASLENCQKALLS